LLKEVRKEGVVGRGRNNTPAKSAETGSESQGFKEDSKTKCSGYMKWKRRF
jgi:hypothetical protein